jgi:lipoic acid synthetase
VFLILGDVCTRGCGFCAVRRGVPRPPDPDEPKKVAEAALSLGLSHVVVTSVTRDDLPDGGARHFARTVEALRTALPGRSIEILVPDFRGSQESWEIVAESAPDVLNHNLETVPRLYPTLRSGAAYARSLDLLRRMSWQPLVVKTGIMIGLGETRDELCALFRDAAEAGVLGITIGQYLQPTPTNHPVVRRASEEEFDELRELARAAGLREVVSGPLVRSSYRAAEFLERLRPR